MSDFGRRNILSLKQNLQARLMELEKDNVYNKYKDFTYKHEEKLQRDFDERRYDEVARRRLG